MSAAKEPLTFDLPNEQAHEFLEQLAEELLWRQGHPDVLRGRHPEGSAG